jgi:hypothetical protein
MRRQKTEDRRQKTEDGGQMMAETTYNKKFLRGPGAVFSKRALARSN